jgi:penicillin-binding protein 1A
MGYVPQLLGGVWVGCDDRFIRNEGAGGFGGAAARPIWEAFFKKVYADKTLGIDKDAKFVKPAELENEINSADIMDMIDNTAPGAEGEDQGVGTQEDYENHEYIGPESQPIKDDENKPLKKDSLNKNQSKKQDDNTRPIGAVKDDTDKKKGFFRRLFGKKNN